MKALEQLEKLKPYIEILFNNGEHFSALRRGTEIPRWLFPSPDDLRPELLSVTRILSLFSLVQNTSGGGEPRASHTNLQSQMISKLEGDWEQNKARMSYSCERLFFQRFFLNSLSSKRHTFRSIVTVTKMSYCNIETNKKAQVLKPESLPRLESMFLLC